MSTPDRTIRIGSRGSPLALKQVEMVQVALAEHFPDLKTELVVIQTSGDWKPEDGDVRLSESEGGKGLFAKEIEAALLAGDIDCGVHSMKDMDSHLPEGLMIDHMLPREDPRDAVLFSNELSNNSQLKKTFPVCFPEGAVIGTASVRRAAFLLSQRGDLKIEPFRGNVHTRIKKIRAGNADATLLAMAGLKRLGLEGEADLILEPEEMLPAAGQGAVGIEIRKGDEDMLSTLSHISDFKTVSCVKSERAVLRVLDGSCHTPIGAHAVLDGTELWLRVCVCSLDGQQRFEDDIRGDVVRVQDAEALGEELGTRLKSVVPDDIFQ